MLYRVCCHYVYWLLAYVFVSWCSVVSATGLYSQGEYSVQQAQRLNRDLTPLGAERAGNGRDIPPWRGGLSMPPLGYKGPGHRRPNPFPEDVPIYSVSSRQLDAFEAFLTPGLREVLLDGAHQILVYPSRRTAAAPIYWYDQTYLNILNTGWDQSQVRSGVPFAIPEDGTAVLANALLRWQGRQYHGFERLYLVEGNRVKSWPLATRAVFTNSFPQQTGFDLPNQIRSRSDRSSGSERRVASWLSWRERSLEKPFHRQYVLSLEARFLSVAELANNVDAPNVPPPSLLANHPNQYHWQLVGKRELLIPYNNYQLFDKEPGYNEFLTSSLSGVGHPDLERIRFEKHRVWVLDGIVKGRSKASYGKQVLYVDEDSWAPVMVDRYSSSGELVAVGLALLTSAYEVPAIVAEFQLEFDFKADRYWFLAMDDKISLSRDYSRLPVSRNR